MRKVFDRTKEGFRNVLDAIDSSLFELISRKVSAWSETPDNTNYPSEKLVKDSLDGKQATLVSGTNLKTVNGNSLLGAGNLSVIGREVLSADRTYFVSLSGSDSNSGLTAGAAFLTVQHAVDVVASLDISIYTVTIQIADGDYQAQGWIDIKLPIGSGTVQLIGNVANRSLVILRALNMSYKNNGVTLFIDSFKLRNGGTCLYLAGSSLVHGRISYVGNAFVIQAAQGSFVLPSETSAGCIVDFTSYGGTVNGLFYAYGQSVIQLQNSTVRQVIFNGNPSFSNGMAYAEGNSYINLASATFTGAFTGTSYVVTAGFGGSNSTIRKPDYSYLT